MTRRYLTQFLLGSAIGATALFVIHGALVAMGLAPALWLFSLITLTHAAFASLFWLMLRETAEERRLRQWTKAHPPESLLRNLPVEEAHRTWKRSGQPGPLPRSAMWNKPSAPTPGPVERR